MPCDLGPGIGAQTLFLSSINNTCLVVATKHYTRMKFWLFFPCSPDKHVQNGNPLSTLTSMVFLYWVILSKELASHILCLLKATCWTR